MINFNVSPVTVLEKASISHTLTHTSHRFLPQPLDPTILFIGYNLTLT